MNSDSKNEAAPGLSGPSYGKKFFFIRHGRTEWNDQLRYQGATDIPLSADGLGQARCAGIRLSKIKADAILTSPLIRARQTAEAIASFHPALQPLVIPELTEVNFGAWEGLTVPQIIDRYGQELFDRWRSDPLYTDAPGGEAMTGLWMRCADAWKKLLGVKGDKIIVIGHGAMLRALFPKILGMERTGAFWKSRLDNCSVSTFLCAPDGRASLVCLNDTNHLKMNEAQIKILPEP